ncbi:MAG: DNA polymerase III subunit epsilon [Rickettsiaceae bacterium]|nr:DNA polymerase III subunit epsilon [Rickettsiaceae bacterium]
MSEREIVLDTETTGLDPRYGHRIVEVGALEIVNKVLTGKKFHYYINPERDMPTEAYRIHNISGEFLKDKPLFKEIATDFLDFVGNSRLIIHNAPFDVKFLNHELNLLNLPSFELAKTIDTLTMAKRKFPGARVNLDALCRRFNIDNSSRVFHGALKDAALLVQVYIELTGGRQESFNIAANNIVKARTTKATTTAKGNKIVVAPTKAELKQHKEFIVNFLNNA